MTMILPQCAFCGRWDSTVACPAFPSRIPDEILENKHDHAKPYEGDNGILFLPRDDFSEERQKSFFAQKSDT